MGTSPFRVGVHYASGATNKDRVQLESEGQMVRYRVLGMVGSKFMD